MIAGILAAATAFLVGVVLTPLVARLCKRFAIFDCPGPLKIHAQPIPRLGGISIAAAIASGCAVAAATGGVSLANWSSIAAAFFLVWIAGLADDLRGLSPQIRLSAQAASAILVWNAGFRFPAFGNGAANVAASVLATCVFIAAFVNSLNLLDGSDGIATGVACVIALAFVVEPTNALSGLGKVVGGSLVGACAAFLISNSPPAKIFMGDSGSTTIGLALALIGLDFLRSNQPTRGTLAFPLIVAALPLLDASLAIVRRIRRGGSPLSGDRRHFYDLLLARGWSPRRVAVACYTITFVFAVTGWLALRFPSPLSLVPGLTGVTAFLVSALRLGSLRARGEPADTSLGLLETRSEAETVCGPK